MCCGTYAPVRGSYAKRLRSPATSMECLCLSNRSCSVRVEQIQKSSPGRVSALRRLWICHGVSAPKAHCISASRSVAQPKPPSVAHRSHPGWDWAPRPAGGRAPAPGLEGLQAAAGLAASWDLALSGQYPSRLISKCVRAAGPQKSPPGPLCSPDRYILATTLPALLT